VFGELLIADASYLRLAAIPLSAGGQTSSAIPYVANGNGAVANIVVTSAGVGTKATVAAYGADART